VLIIFVEKNKNRAIIGFIILFCLIIVPSLGLASETRGLFRDENYTIILISLPEIIHNPETWNTIYSDVSSMNSLFKDNNVRSFIRKNSLKGKSVSEVAEIYNGIVYINSPEYAYSKIIFPKENYENVTEIFRSLGFEVRDNIPMEPDLDHSRSAIGLPYTYQKYGNEYELVGWGRTIAIIDSGIDPNHPDFQVPSFGNKVTFWNDTTSEQKHDPLDEFGHGTHIASIAAGREGDCSGTPYYCSYYSGDYNIDGIIDIRDIMECLSAGCNSSGYDNICSGTPNPCNNYDGYQHSCERHGCAWSENLFKGVAPYAKLKIWKVSADIDHYEAQWIADAINQAVREGTDVISLSVSGDANIQACTGQTHDDFRELYDAIINAINNNITVVASAGNSGPLDGTVRFPACIDDVIAVGSTFKKDYDCFMDATWGYRCWWRNSPTPIDTVIAYYVNVTSENELLMWGGYGGSRSDWSGFQMVFEPNIWPITIEVKVEGRDTRRECWPYDCWDICECWNPGNCESGDEYWIWTETLQYNSKAPYVVVELFNRPYINTWWCIEGGGWHHYYDQSRIYVEIYRTYSITNQGLPVYKSGRGPAPQGTVKPDLTAPGEEIIAARVSDSSTLENNYGCNVYDDNYISCSGTSMATPHVAGLVALLKETTFLLGTNPTLDDIRQALIRADNKLIVPNNPDNIEGYGKINVIKAVDYITDCDFYQAYDTDGGYEPKVKGTCYDYQWSGSSCIETPHSDYCIGSYVYEYEASDLECTINSVKYCKDYGIDWTCSYGKCVYSPSDGGGGGGGGGGGRRTKK